MLGHVRVIWAGRGGEGGGGGREKLRISVSYLCIAAAAWNKKLYI